MRTLRYTYWQDQEYFLGYLNDFPEYETQALSKEELVHNLKSLLEDIESGEVPFVRRVEDLVVA
jgi:predicted RNase H-like HicB family nuclease